MQKSIENILMKLRPSFNRQATFFGLLFVVQVLFAELISMVQFLLLDLLI